MLCKHSSMRKGSGGLVAVWNCLRVEDSVPIYIYVDVLLDAAYVE